MTLHIPTELGLSHQRWVSIYLSHKCNISLNWKWSSISVANKLFIKLYCNTTSRLLLLLVSPFIEYFLRDVDALRQIDVRLRVVTRQTRVQNKKTGALLIGQRLQFLICDRVFRNWGRCGQIRYWNESLLNIRVGL